MHEVDDELVPWWPDTAQRLGGVSRSTVYRLIKAGELESTTVRRRRFVPASAIRRYKARNSQTAESA